MFNIKDLALAAVVVGAWFAVMGTAVNADAAENGGLNGFWLSEARFNGDIPVLEFLEIADDNITDGVLPMVYGADACNSSKICRPRYDLKKGVVTRDRAVLMISSVEETGSYLYSFQDYLRWIFPYLVIRSQRYRFAIEDGDLLLEVNGDIRRFRRTSGDHVSRLLAVYDLLTLPVSSNYKCIFEEMNDINVISRVNQLYPIWQMRSARYNHGAPVDQNAPYEITKTKWSTEDIVFASAAIDDYVAHGRAISSSRLGDPIRIRDVLRDYHITEESLSVFRNMVLHRPSGNSPEHLDCLGKVR